ncbi:glycoside hydrolase family 75 protein [Streptomyces sp. CB02400]|uniref:glycoside hydrolase family 75 protein n=1 Tax=Streptomyces sp. CB02400 TaxID=1703944 RepID=UPI001F2D78BE|nr:glycoside hydrolase family 75 protein [Streptomyces sp. CB02400]
MSRVQSLTLAMAGVALLAPSAPPATAPQPRPEPAARRTAPAPATTAPAEARSEPAVRRTAPAPTPAEARADEPPARRTAPVSAADLLAKVRTCAPVSRGRYREDHGAKATVPVCGTRDAVFWKADMDIDCDGRPGLRCNARTDPYFSSSTAFAQSDGRPLSSEETPYVVVPAPSAVWNHRSHGVRGGSVVAVVYRDRVRYGVVGDTGPADIIGEASYAMAESLGIDPDPHSGGTPSGVTYIVFKDSRVTPIEDHQAAVTAGERLARRFVDADE